VGSDVRAAQTAASHARRCRDCGFCNDITANNGELETRAKKPEWTIVHSEMVSQAEAPPHELEYVPDAPEPTLTEFDAADVVDNMLPMGNIPESELLRVEASPPLSEMEQMERDIEERGGTAHYFEVKMIGKPKKSKPIMYARNVLQSKRKGSRLASLWTTLCPPKSLFPSVCRTR
jgi:hypothetical protein